MQSKSKFRRYYTLIKNFSNWPQYLRFKAVESKPSFNFQLRDSFSIRVPRQMLSPFRECFFDHIYLKHLPDEALNFRNPTIVDIGANVGFYSLFMFSRYPQASIYSFEPMPFNFSTLQDYQKTYPSFDWHIDSRAVSASDQAITLHASKLDAFTTMASVFDASYNTERIEVEAITLPQILSTYRIEHIDILKLDCEGSEYAIVYTLPEELLKKVSVMMIETHQGAQAEESTDAMVAYLRKHGFALNYLHEGKSGYIWAWRPY